MHNWLIFQYHRVRAKPKIGNEGAVERRSLRAGGG